MVMNKLPCTCCGQEKANGHWWSLSNYHGLSGRFCPKCYEKVSHDPYGNPKHPEQYTMILLRMGK